MSSRKNRALSMRLCRTSTPNLSRGNKHRCLCDFRYTFTSGRTLDGCLSEPLPFIPRHLMPLGRHFSHARVKRYTSRLPLHSPNDACNAHTPRQAANHCFGTGLIAARSQENAPKMPSSSRRASGHGGRSRASVSMACTDAWVPH